MVKNKLFYTSALALVLLILPSCKWFSGDSCATCTGSDHKADKSEVLISIDGKSALTANQFDDYINQMAEGNDQFRLMLQLMPDFKEQLFNRKKQTLIFSEWAKRNGVRNKSSYKEKEKKYLDAIREALDTEEFIAGHKVEITDEDVKKFYDEKKDQHPGILISPAGINASGVTFNVREMADEFADKLRNVYKRDINRLAKERKLDVEDFGSINSESPVDAKVKAKVLEAKNLPNVLVIKGENGKFWVVIAKGKEAAKYRTLEESKELIKRVLTPQKLETMIELEVPKYEKEFKIEENKKYFEASKKESENKMQEALKGIQASQSQQPQAENANVAEAK